MLNQMVIISHSYLPNEFGGIFAGIKYDNLWHITDFEIPIIYSHSNLKFTRDAEYLNDYLEEIYQKSNGKIEYLGEWHTHPFGSTKYSTDDLNSMSEIAKEINTKNETPILAIINVSYKKFYYKFYQYQNNNLIELT
ncbi:Mov34/MPN/PAD-1 family protein [Bacteroidales bacterium OttesenSCG-928-K03]|nr:Mov34/MPN/PAD-1 family protein [Bacteroidales bacterium OttesenSCG-928-L14]MDL2242457.1 Mov34/MPN/PAD-1 family protein [Bacteroidales bacterium OttesenSCG-928-K03]